MHPSDINGPGLYDAVTSFVREQTRAQGVAVVIFGGMHGQGFSVQGSALFVESLPDVLEDVARKIRAQRQSATTTETKQ
jgi:hypothetical protein